MLNVSTAWQEASREQFRYQAYLSATLEIAPPGLREGAIITSEQTSPNAVADTIMDGSFAQPAYYGSLEPNRTVLDGSVRLLSKTQKLTDWWANTSGEVTVHFEFDKVYSIPGMYIQWDLESNSWPTKMIVKGYDVDGTQQYEITVENISSTTGIYDVVMNDVKTVDIVISDCVNPGWVVRINELMFGLYVDFNSENNGRISSATVTSKSDPLSESLPVHTASITLRNIDKYFDPELKTGVAQYIAQQQVMKLKWGFNVAYNQREYSEQLSYLVESIDVPQDSKDVTLNLTSRLAMLTNTFKLGTYTGAARTLYDIAQYVLENSDVFKTQDTEVPWILPDSLRNISTLAPIPAEASNVILQYIALVGCMWLSTKAENGFIQLMESSSEASPYCAIDKMQQLGDPNFTIQDRLRSISIAISNYTISSTTEQLAKGTYYLVGQQVLEVKYNKDFATSVTASVSGATLIEASYYNSYAIITVKASESGANVTVTVNGREIVRNLTYVETYRNNSVSDGIDVTIENPFITDTTHISEITQHVKKYYSKQVSYKIPYIGYVQLEPADRINLNTVYGSGDVDVTGNTIEFNGAWTGTTEAI